MKIAFLFHWNQGLESGVYKKVESQVRFWQLLGHKVGVFQISSASAKYIEGKRDFWKFFYYRPSSFLRRLNAWKSAIEELIQWQPDVVYHRFDLWYPALTMLFDKVPLVLEINTDDLKEYCLFPGLRCIHNYLTRGFLLRRATGFVFVSKELANKSSFIHYCNQNIVIGNGIDLESYNTLPLPYNKTPRLVFIGSEGQSWHGVDKIIKLADCKKDWVFELIGIKPEGRKMSNIFFHGTLPRREYERILAKADVAIGTLALHRKGMNEASPLKVREYLAYGLPTIIGYKDTDFLDPVPFLLELPNIEENVIEKIVEIEAFVHKWRDKRIPRSEVVNLDIRKKEQMRLSFLEEVSNQRT